MVQTIYLATCTRIQTVHCTTHARYLSATMLFVQSEKKANSFAVTFFCMPSQSKINYTGDHCTSTIWTKKKYHHDLFVHWRTPFTSRNTYLLGKEENVVEYSRYFSSSLDDRCSCCRGRCGRHCTANPAQI